MPPNERIMVEKKTLRFKEKGLRLQAPPATRTMKQFVDHIAEGARGCYGKNCHIKTQLWAKQLRIMRARFNSKHGCEITLFASAAVPQYIPLPVTPLAGDQKRCDVGSGVDGKTYKTSSFRSLHTNAYYTFQRAEHCGSTPRRH